MALTLYVLTPILLFTLSIPLTLLAMLTTSLAFSVLIVRLSLVYFELALALFRSYLFLDFSRRHSSSNINRINIYSKSIIFSSSTSSTTSLQSDNSHRATQLRRRNSSTDFFSSIPTKSPSNPSLIGSSIPNRDFESVGGWRIPTSGEDDGLWLGPSRLQLPTPTNERRRHHQRSLTGGSEGQSRSCDWRSLDVLRVSPVASRTWTPNRSGTASPENICGSNAGRGGVLMSPREETTGKRILRERERRGSACSGSGSGGISSSGSAEGKATMAAITSDMENERQGVIGRRTF